MADIIEREFKKSGIKLQTNVKIENIVKDPEGMIVTPSCLIVVALAVFFHLPLLLKYRILKSWRTPGFLVSSRNIPRKSDFYVSYV